MSNFLRLTRVFFLSGFNVNKKKQNQKSSFRTLLIFGLLFLGLSFYYNYMFVSLATEQGLDLNNYLLMVLVIDAMLVFITTLFQMQKSIFKTRDYEFLESIPVSKFNIVAAKFNAVYLIGLFEDLIITIPALILYLIYSGNPYIALLVFISAFFVSIIPLLVASLLGAVIALATSRLKNQNIFTIIFYLLFMVGIMFVSMTLSSGGAIGIDPSSFTRLLPYFTFLSLSFDSSKFYYFIIFILIHVVAYCLTILFMAKIYRPINTYLGNYKIHEEYKVGKDLESLSVDKMLSKKERKMLFSNSQYVLNSFAGSIGYIIIGVMFVFMPSIFASDPEMSEEEFIMMKAIFTSLIPMFGMLMNSISASSTVSLSLEGRTKLELLNSYPISPKQIVKAKLKLSLKISCLLSSTVGIIISVLSIFTLGLNIPFILSVLLLPVLASILTSIVGMLCNLRWIKLDFENEMQVVKNSASVNFTMLFVALPTLILGSLYVFLNMIINPYIVIGIYVVIYAVIILIMYKNLNKRSVRLFRKLVLK